jgi:protein O-mannosyl-transferase
VGAKTFQSFPSLKTITTNRYFYMALLALATFIIFCQVIGYEFVMYDDDFTLYENPHYQSGAISDLVYFWENPYKDAYIPVTFTFLGIEALFAKTMPSDVNINGFIPAFFHASNLIFHIINTILVFIIVRILVKDELASFFGALLFAIHPVQVEPVAWVTGVKDVFSGFLSLVAIWQYLLYAQISKEEDDADQHGVKENRDRKRRTLHYLIAIFSFILAILAKPTRVVVPIVAFTLDYFILKRKLKDVIVSTSGWIAVAVPVIVATILLMPASGETTFNYSFLDRLLVTSDSMVFYLYKLIVPVSLGPDYGRTPKFVLSQPFIYVAWMIPSAVLIIICILKKQRSWLLASAAIFVAGVLPMLGFIYFKFQAISTVADRYLYLSMVGPGLALAFFLSRYKKPLVIVLCGVVLGILGILSMVQTRNWENTITLYRQALQVNPISPAFCMNLGIALGEEGNYDEAIYHFNKMLKSNTRTSEAHVNIGLALLKQQKLDEAVYHFNEALRIDPDEAGAHINYAHALIQQGKFNEAIAHYTEAIRIEPNNPMAYLDSGYILVQLGRFDEAIPFFSEALRLNPKNVKALSSFGYALAHQGKLNEAISRYSEALNLDPSNAWLHNNLGIALAQQGKLDDAMYHFNVAISIKPGYQDAHKNLSMAKSLKK